LPELPEGPRKVPERERLIILIDPRTGSRELLPLLLKTGCEAELAGADLPGDFMFEGNGPDGNVLVVIERKTIEELLTVVRDRRLAGTQIGGMLDVTEISFLIIEGIWGKNDYGRVDIMKHGRYYEAHGSHDWGGVWSFLLTIALQSSVMVIQTHNEEETAAWIANCERWFQKPWDAHKTSKEFYVPKLSLSPKERASGHWRTKSASVKERWLAAIPGLDRLAIELAKEFRLPRDIVFEHDWQKYDGIGEGREKAIMEAIHGEPK